MVGQHQYGQPVIAGVADEADLAEGAAEQRPGKEAGDEPSGEGMAGTDHTGRICARRPIARKKST